MLSKELVIDTLKKIKPLLMEKYSIKNIGLYGSYAKNLQTEDSDIDVVIELTRGLAWDFFDIQILLEDKFNKQIDLTTKQSLHPDLKNQILKETIFV